MRNMIMIVGAAGSGKDTVGEALSEQIPGGVEVKFADPLKDFCCAIFAWDREQLKNDLGYKQQEVTIGRGQTWSRRELMQFIGTDLLRDQLDPDVWVDAAINRMLQTEKETGPPAYWYSADTRFMNEFEAYKDFAGNRLVIRVERTDHEIATSDHASEQEWKEIPYDVLIRKPSGHTKELADTAVRFVREYLKEIS